VRALYRIAEDKAEMLEFAASADMTGIIGVPLKDLKLKPNILIGCIVRKNRAIIPGGADVIEPNDRVLVCTAGRRLTELTDILGA
jgi:trk system potassium uptake protein TrkA